MSEYTYYDLIINPNKEGLESLIGKEVYYSDVPLYCIRSANENYKIGILREVLKNEAAPFRIEISMGCILNYACIIPKKEDPKPEFTPFTSAEEFLDAYDNANSSIGTDTMEDRLLSYGGLWLKGKDSGAYYMVTEIWGCGLVIDDINMKTTKIGKDRYLTVDGVTHWKDLLGYYTFMDGSPCGSLNEVH